MKRKATTHSTQQLKLLRDNRIITTCNGDSARGTFERDTTHNMPKSFEPTPLHLQLGLKMENPLALGTAHCTGATGDGPFTPIVCFENEGDDVGLQSDTFTCHQGCERGDPSQACSSTRGERRRHDDWLEAGGGSTFVGADFADFPVLSRSEEETGDGAGVDLTEDISVWCSSGSESSSSLLFDDQPRNLRTRKRVSFAENMVSEVNYRPKTTPEEWPKLYYTAHEIQRMWDESRAESEQVEGSTELDSFIGEEEELEFSL
mmetsp:Transcript_6185/g.10581  ORF Transcript_6185/g.10581 Transcript_6185/m.10581 type:complete len:261 (-) Transcript_6185:83-865(-)